MNRLALEEMKAPCQCKHCVLLALVLRGPQLQDQAQHAIGTEFSITYIFLFFIFCKTPQIVMFLLSAGSGSLQACYVWIVEAVYNEGSVIIYLIELQVKPADYFSVPLCVSPCVVKYLCSHLMRLQEYNDVNYCLLYIQTH